MKLKIVHESRGRIRFRLGNGRFLKSQECPIEELLSALPYVRDAKASSVNGGILVLYKQGFRDELVSYMKGIKISAVEKRPTAKMRMRSSFAANWQSLLSADTPLSTCSVSDWNCADILQGNSVH